MSFRIITLIFLGMLAVEGMLLVVSTNRVGGTLYNLSERISDIELKQ